VLVTMVLPRFVYCNYGGPIPANIFSGLALLGIVVGVAMYYRPAGPIVSCVSKRTMPALMSTENSRKKWAA
jgi:hypothetical protein